jgi:hypothetical protein
MHTHIGISSLSARSEKGRFGPINIVRNPLYMQLRVSCIQNLVTVTSHLRDCEGLLLS